MTNLDDIEERHQRAGDDDQFLERQVHYHHDSVGGDLGALGSFGSSQHEQQQPCHVHCEDELSLDLEEGEDE